MWISGCRSRNEDGVAGNQFGQFQGLRPHLVVNRGFFYFDVEDMCSFFKSGVDAVRYYYFGRRDVRKQLAGPFAVGVHCQENTLGTPRSHRARHVFIAVQQTGRHLNDFQLHFFQTLKSKRIEVIFGKKTAIGLSQEFLVGIIYVINHAPGAAGFPGYVV